MGLFKKENLEKEVKEALDKIIRDEIENLPNLLKEFQNPKDRFDNLMRLLEYALPPVKDEKTDKT